MEEMMRMYNMGSNYPVESTFMINTASKLIQKLESIASADPELATQMASYIYKLALLSQKKFSAEEMQSFTKDGFELMMKL
jgi:HSP90 family molecular chaperone